MGRQERVGPVVAGSAVAAVVAADGSVVAAVQATLS
jgi:hypothetical protein